MQTVDQQIAIIKANMPETYKTIQDKAKEVGQTAYSYVRRGLRGVANCFYAFENGYVMGAPFFLTTIMQATAYCMVGFGLKHVVIWWDVTATTGASDGAH